VGTKILTASITFPQFFHVAFAVLFAVHFVSSTDPNLAFTEHHLIRKSRVGATTFFEPAFQIFVHG
jgi:hypothetical protein